MSASPGERLLQASKTMTDAPDLYLEAARYWVLSSTLGRHVVVPYFPRPPDNPLRPNTWIILSGVPGIMRKSTVIDSIARIVVKTAWREFYRSTLTRLQPGTIEEMVGKMFIETGSYEGIVKHIAETQNDIDTFFLISTEWGGLMQLSKSREYMTGLSTLLSKLYSGEEHVARYAKETRYLRGGLYVTALLGMQEPWLYLDNLVFRQGLMRRMVFVYQKPEDKDRWLPPLDLRRMQVVEELISVGESLALRMRELDERKPVEARFSAETIRFINDYAQSIEEEIRSNGNSNWGLYAQNLWEHLTKLAVLEALDRGAEIREEGLTAHIYVLEEDVQRASSFIERTIPRAREALSVTGTPIRELEVRTSQAAEELVRSVIESSGCITTTELLRGLRMLKDDLKPIIVNMAEKGDIIVAKIPRTRGRPPIVICKKESYNNLAARNPAVEKLAPGEIEVAW